MEMATDTQTATVQVLTAEVRVLHLGARQAAPGVYRQLDPVPWASLAPFGRVRDPAPRVSKSAGRCQTVEVIGADRSGNLARCWLDLPHDPVAQPGATGGDGYLHDPGGWYADQDEAAAVWDAANALPLIVLAGLS
jgi:hypothetical protein